MLKGLLDRLRGVKEKQKVTPEERLKVERLIVDLGLSDKELRLPPEELALTAFTKAEKQRLYALRNLIKFLPSTITGAVVTSTAALLEKTTDKKVSKQYVHQCLFPYNPHHLFKRRNITHKQIWMFMEQAIIEMIRTPTEVERRVHAYLEEKNKALVEEELGKLGYTLLDAKISKDKQVMRDRYRHLAIILYNIAEGNSVVAVNVDIPKYDYLMRKIRSLGLKVQVTEDLTTIPSTFIFTPIGGKPAQNGSKRAAFWITETALANGGIRVVSNYTRILPEDRVYVGEEESIGGEKHKVFHLIPDA